MFFLFPFLHCNAVFLRKHKVSLIKCGKLLQHNLTCLIVMEQQMSWYVIYFFVFLKWPLKKLLKFAKLQWHTLHMICLACSLLVVNIVKFIYSEKATKFCEIFTLLFTTVPQVNSPGNNLIFHWRWWDRIQAIFLNLFYFTLEYVQFWTKI